MEVGLLQHKTAKAGRQVLLPIVAPSVGVSGVRWAEAWLKARESQHLDAASSGCLMPTPRAGGGWSDVRLNTMELSIALRGLLRSGGFSDVDLTNIGCHSLKATALSWVAKAGVCKSIRRTLGGHAKPKDRSMAAYSRDELAAPLRELVRVLGMIRSRDFNPEATRSGRLAGLIAAESPQVTAQVPLSASRSSSSSSSRSCSPCSSSSSVSSTSQPESLNLIQNKATKMIHCAFDSEFLVCGRRFPANFCELTSLKGCARRCRGCF